MADGVDVDIDDRLIISACNTPGGGVYEWRDDAAVDVGLWATARSPVNDPSNARHRGRVRGSDPANVPGLFKKSWGWDRMGSNGHRVRATIYNGAPHAQIVEYGRRDSVKWETFAWTGHRPRGAIRTHVGGTRGRRGTFILHHATNTVMPTKVDGYTPLALG